MDFSNSVNSLIKYLLFGLVQGLIEWLPISSEGNLVLIMISIFGLNPDEIISTVIFLHLGTGIAALVYFRKEIFKIIIGKTIEYKDLRIKLIVITFITGIVGLPIYLWLNLSAVYGEAILALTGLALIITGLVQRQVDNKEHDGAVLSWPLAFVLGSVQGFSIIPGLSRSGITTSIMLLNEFTAEQAFNLSFLMSIPASFAAALGMMILDGFAPNRFTLLSAFVAAIVGFFSISLLLKIARKFSFWKICISLGILAFFAWLPNLIW